MRCWVAAVLVAIAFGLSPGRAGADEASIQPEATPATNPAPTPAQAAYARMTSAKAVFEAHCARCHEQAVVNGGSDDAPAPAGTDETSDTIRRRASSHLSRILDLEALARQPEFVRPGQPEASRLLQMMVARQMPFDVFQVGSKHAEPSDAEIEAVADWIFGLPVPSPCVPAGANGPVGGKVQRWAEGPLLREAERGRVAVILLGAPNDCRGGSPDLAQRRRLAAAVLAGAGGTSQEVVVALAVPGAANVIAIAPVAGREAAFDMTELAAEQDASARARLTIAGLTGPGMPVAFDLSWLAERAVDDVVSGGAASLDGDLRTHAEMLARHGYRSITLADAASDLGLKAGAFDGVLSRYNGRETVAARALLQGGGIPLMHWHRLLRDMAGIEPDALATPATQGGDVGSPASDAPPVNPSHPGEVASAAKATVIDDPVASAEFNPPVPVARPGDIPPAFRGVMPDGLRIWSTPVHGRVGDEIAVSVVSDHDCRLTLVNIDTTGRATVLFPNMFTPDNHLRAGAVIEIPSDDDPYVLALQAAGRETFLAICLMEDRAAPPGIAHDFEIKPFTPLGDWKAFRRTALAADQRERGLVGQKLTRRKARQLRSKGILERATKLPLRQMRAAIDVEIAPSASDTSK